MHGIVFQEDLLTPLFPRSSGVLLHPTSLPGPYGIGDLGTEAYRFVDRLAEAGQSIWQVLPLGPTGFGESPYQCFSAFAGNANLISLDRLVEYGWLSEEDLAHRPFFSQRKVDYPTVIAYHDELLSLAYDRFVIDGPASQQAAFAAWCAHPDRWWLDDFALFMALKEFYGGRPWTAWRDAEALREKQALGAARVMHATRLQEHRFRQWLFDVQWQALKAYANARGIRVFGDIPIYVALDSAEVWTAPELFELNQDGSPTFVAGVPPDYFSATGQRWGNALYDWDEHRRTGYDWWFRRIRAALTQLDLIRIDHFRAFDRYYKIPAQYETAQGGRWVNGPGAHFLDALRDTLVDDGYDADELPIVAEDLGDDLGNAIQLRQDYKLPGMAIMQFAFGGSEEETNRFLPHRHERNLIVYTGTHDNNTVWGWWTSEAGAAVQADLKRYLVKWHVQRHARINWQLIWLGMTSRAHTFIAPLQDILGSGPSTRMNRPGVPGGNWRWRCLPADLDPDTAHWSQLRALTVASQRTVGGQ
ncbi:MAG: 4-alpha-glucanotransferase [Chloroflexi bacterium]|nr:4-alpha-glucanotransferase [Chloroflexota bacterium]